MEAQIPSQPDSPPESEYVEQTSEGHQRKLAALARAREKALAMRRQLKETKYRSKQLKEKEIEVAQAEVDAKEAELNERLQAAKTKSKKHVVLPPPPSPEPQSDPEEDLDAYILKRYGDPKLQAAKEVSLERSKLAELAFRQQVNKIKHDMLMESIFPRC